MQPIFVPHFFGLHIHFYVIFLLIGKDYVEFISCFASQYGLSRPEIIQTNCRYSNGFNCAPLVADLFLFCYERDLMLCLSDNNQTDIIEAFNSTSRYLDDLLTIDNPYFEQMVGLIYPTELQLNKANSSDTEAPFLDLLVKII